MPKFVYCAKCGYRSVVIRKAVPSIGRIVDMIEPHVCSDDPYPLDLEPLEVPIPSESLNKDENKFVKNLNDLKRPSGISTVNIQDRRDKFNAEVKTTAPPTVFDNIRNMIGSTPEHDLEE